MNREHDAKAFMEKAAGYGSVLGLSSITELMKQLKNPQDDLQIIHVAGTNGKGSTIAFLSSILQRAGYRIGVYTSPAVFDYRERFVINGQWISEKNLCEYLIRLKNVCERIVEEGKSHPTLFEIETALAFLYFKEEHCDYVLLEVGMGGETDATNVISHSLCSVFASFGRDHMQFLGESLFEIATVKAGILKEGGCGVSIWQEPEVVTAIVAVAEKKNARVTFAQPPQLDFRGKNSQVFSYKEFTDVSIPLAGSYQLDNAVLALETVLALRRLGVYIPNEAVYEGMASAKWPGRMECISVCPRVYLDGAHNLPAAMRLRETIELYFTNRTITYIIGVLADKEYKQLLNILLPFANHIVAITPHNPRALPASDLAAAIRSLGYEAYESKSMKDGVFYAMEQKDDLILAFGSLSYLKDCETSVLQWKKEQENV